MNEFKLSPIENEGKRVLTTAQLAEAYGTDSKVISDNFNNNIKRYTGGKHFYRLTGNELKEFLHSENFGLQNPNKIRVLYLWTEKGALLHAKSLNTDKAWEVYDFLVENYFQKKSPDYTALSPQLQFMIQMEQRQNAIESRQEAQETAIENTNKRLDDMREVISLDPNSWRTHLTDIIHKIVKTSGGDFKSVQLVYDELYKLVDQRGGVSLKTRLANKRNRMAGEGVCKSKISKINRLDIIAEDKKLVEITLAIVKEMAVKYGICLEVKS